MAHKCRKGFTTVYGLHSPGELRDGIYPKNISLENRLTALAPAFPGVLLGASAFLLSLSSLSFFSFLSVPLNRTEVWVKPKAWGSKRSQTFTYLFNLKSFPRTCPFLPLLIYKLFIYIQGMKLSPKALRDLELRFVFRM